MGQKIQQPDRSLHGLGIGYVYSQLSCEGYTIFEMNSAPDKAYQIVAKKDDELVSIAIRTAPYPDMGSIDRTECKQLLKESEQLDAVPCFVGFAARSLNASDQLAGSNVEKEYQMISNGMTSVEKC